MLTPIPLVSGMTRVTTCTIVDHDTGDIHEVGLVAATVTVDRKSECRRVVSATITADVDPALLSAPHRLRIRSGYRVHGVDYLADVAHVRITHRERGPLGAWTVQGVSFEALLRGARFTAPRRVEGSAVTAIQALILEAVPWATVSVETSRDVILAGSGVVYDRERLEAIVGRESSLASAAGVDVFCDGTGVFVVGDPPAATSPAWDATRLETDWRESLDSTSVVNSWVVSTEHPDVPAVSAVVEDVDPWSPTRVDRWGTARQFFASPILRDLSAAQRAGQTLLDGSRGIQVDLTVTTPPNPWADITDPLIATGDTDRGLFLLDRLTHEIRADLNEPLTLVTQSRLIGVGDGIPSEPEAVAWRMTAYPGEGLYPGVTWPSFTG